MSLLLFQSLAKPHTVLAGMGVVKTAMPKGFGDNCLAIIDVKAQTEMPMEITQTPGKEKC